MKKTAVLILRIGIAFSFFYAAISSFINPSSWIGFFPQFITNILGNTTATIFSIYEILLGLWILSGKKAFYSATLSAITVAGIVILNFGAIDIVFRDITILFASIALALLSKNEPTRI